MTNQLSNCILLTAYDLDGALTLRITIKVWNYGPPYPFTAIPVDTYYYSESQVSLIDFNTNSSFSYTFLHFSGTEILKKLT